jgi:predicted class III extradiol MEMO1 family dioxygenase
VLPLVDRGSPDGLVAIEKLRKTGKFDVMDLETDSDEHSLEMHLPYIRLMFQNS